MVRWAALRAVPLVVVRTVVAKEVARSIAVLRAPAVDGQAVVAAVVRTVRCLQRIWIKRWCLEVMVV